MRDPLSRSFALLHSSADSWILRVRENLRQLFATAPFFPSSANGAPIHLLPFKRSSTAGSSRTVSFITHAAVIAGILFLSTETKPVKKIGSGSEILRDRGLTYVRPPEDVFGQPSVGKKSGGGENDSRPTRFGDLARGSSMPLLPPRQVVNTKPELPVPSSVFDANAPRFPAVVVNLGLPWMKDDTESAGPGKQHGFGAGKKDGMGDDEGPGAGQSNGPNGRYVNVLSLPKCAYCPDPQYTDEAREARLQGAVTLLVLVGADGRASQVRVVKGIGLGLDDRAAEAIRTWRFIPAYDGARHPVVAWVTVEAVFRLF